VTAVALLEALLAALVVAAWPQGRTAAGTGVVRLLALRSPPDPGGRLAASARPDQRHGIEAVAAAEDLLALALQGGCGVAEAIESVASLSGGEVARQLRTVSAAIRWGMDPADAWSSVSPVWQSAARALVLSSHAGVPPGDLLAAAADELRRGERQRLEIATARLGVRLVLPLGLAFLPGFVLTTVVLLVLALARQALGS